MSLVRKKSGSWRPIIDLSALKKFVVSPQFKMETPRGVISAIRPGQCTTSIPEGRLFPYSHFEIGQEVPPIQFQQQSLPVPIHAIRFHDIFLGIYQDASCRDFFSASSRNRYPHLFRRFSSPSIFRSRVEPENPNGSFTSNEARLHSLQEEVRHNPISGFCFPGISVPYRFWYCTTSFG